MPTRRTLIATTAAAVAARRPGRTQTTPGASGVLNDATGPEAD